MTTPTKIPAWLELDRGSHRGRCGVSVEECLSLLLGQDKTDKPDRVHPIIRDLAIQANSEEDNPEKRRLLARTLAGQVDTDDVPQEVTNGLAAFVCRYSAERLPDGTDERVGAALIAAAECLENPTDETRAWNARAATRAWNVWNARAVWAARTATAARAATAAWNARAAFYADLLTALIAEFDRLTGRVEWHKFTKADWDRVHAALTNGEPQ
jgi:hypothetical protein